MTDITPFHMAPTPEEVELALLRRKIQSLESQLESLRLGIMQLRRELRQEIADHLHQPNSLPTNLYDKR